MGGKPGHGKTSYNANLQLNTKTKHAIMLHHTLAQGPNNTNRMTKAASQSRNLNVQPQSSQVTNPTVDKSIAKHATRMASSRNF